MIHFKNDIYVLKSKRLYQCFYAHDFAHSSNRQGFTLIEVLLAMAIMALVLTPIFVTQGTLLQSVSKVSRKMARIFFEKQFLFDTAFKTQLQEQKDTPLITIEKNFNDPEVFLTYEVLPIPKNSKLVNFADVYIERVKSRLQQDNKNQQIDLVTFAFKPPLPKKRVSQ
jgi:prepilin-type N-terminal cleavage/methylation domain-containing protein